MLLYEVYKYNRRNFVQEQRILDHRFPTIPQPAWLHSKGRAKQPRSLWVSTLVPNESTYLFLPLCFVLSDRNGLPVFTEANRANWRRYGALVTHLQSFCSEDQLNPHPRHTHTQRDKEASSQSRPCLLFKRWKVGQKRNPSLPLFATPGRT